MKSTNTNIRNNQQGVVTIVIVILIILLMSLIVLAMSRNASREQRQALDRQLNNQAFYAAESGINDFIKKINDPNMTEENGKTCDNELAGPLSAGSSIEITCVLYDKTPDTLVFGEISLSDSKVVPLQSADGINTLHISFEAKDITNPVFSGCSNFNSGNFPPRPVNNCDAGVLRIDLVRTNDPTRDNLLNDTFTLFIVPSSAAGTPSYSYVVGQQGAVARANCSSGNTPRKCKIDITGLDIGADQRMYLNMRSIYTPNAVEIGSDTGSFKNAQIFIDSTGKSTDVLKRLQVNVPVHALTNSPHPAFSVQSATDLCKLLQVRPGDSVTVDCNID